MHRRSFVSLGIGVIGAQLWMRAGESIRIAPVASPAASPDPLRSGSPVATATRRYAASGRFAWEQIGAAYLRVEVARFTTLREASAAFQSIPEQQTGEDGAAALAPVKVRVFANGTMAWAGFDDNGRPAALLVGREGRDVHRWFARQVAHGGRTPSRAEPLRALVAIATSVFTTARSEPDTTLAALPGPEHVPGGLQPFEERQSLATPASADGESPDATPSL